MEKYRRFADEKTGKHPFLPLKTPQPAFELILGILLFPFKLALLSALILLSVVLSFVFRGSQFSFGLIIDQLLAKLILLVLNVRTNILSAEELAKIRQSPAIVLSNHSSFIDILIAKSL